MLYEDISKIMSAHDIEVSMQRTETNPFITVADADDLHKYCVLRGRGIEEFDFYVSHSPDIEPTVLDCLSVLIKDIDIYKDCDGYADFLRVFGLTEEEDRATLKVCWTELERLSPMVDQLHELAARQSNEPSAPAMR